MDCLSVFEEGRDGGWLQVLSGKKERQSWCPLLGQALGGAGVQRNVPCSDATVSGSDSCAVASRGGCQVDRQVFVCQAIEKAFTYTGWGIVHKCHHHITFRNRHSHDAHSTEVLEGHMAGLGSSWPRSRFSQPCHGQWGLDEELGLVTRYLRQALCSVH